MNTPIWIKEEVAIAIHLRQLAEHGGAEGIRDMGLLESALFRPQNQFAYGDPNIFELAAAYSYGIANNHPFIDGNKRTSYVKMRTFLKLNGYDLRASVTAKYEIWMRLVNDRLSEAELAAWIEGKSIKV